MLHSTCTGHCSTRSSLACQQEQSVYHKLGTYLYPSGITLAKHSTCPCHLSLHLLITSPIASTYFSSHFCAGLSFSQEITTHSLIILNFFLSICESIPALPLYSTASTHAVHSWLLSSSERALWLSGMVPTLVTPHSCCYYCISRSLHAQQVALLAKTIDTVILLTIYHHTFFC